jgi:hypothetical protein
MFQLGRSPVYRFSGLWTIALAVLLGALLRCWLAAERPVFIDEATSINTARQASYSDLLLWKHNDGTCGSNLLTDPDQPPLSFLILKLSIGLTARTDLWTARFIPMVVGILCIPAAYYLGALIYSPLLGCWAAMLAACDPILVSQSATARPWSICCFVTLMALILLVQLVQTDFQSKALCCLLGVFLGIGLLNNQLALASWLAVAIACLLELVRTLIGKRANLATRDRLLGYSLILLSAMALGFEGIQDILVRRLHQSGGSPPSILTVSTDMLYSFQGVFPAPVVWRLILGSALVGALCLFVEKPKVMVPVAALTCATLLLDVLLRQRHDFFASRYLIPLLPVLWVGLAIWPLLGHRRGLRLVASGLLCAVMARDAYVCLNTAKNWRYDYDYFVGAQMRELKDEIAIDDKVSYFPRYAAVLGRFCEIPISQELTEDDGGYLRENQLGKGQVLWFIAGHLNRPHLVEEAKTRLETIVSARGLVVDPAQIERHFALNRFASVRISSNGLIFKSASPAH